PLYGFRGRTGEVGRRILSLASRGLYLFGDILGRLGPVRLIVFESSFIHGALLAFLRFQIALAGFSLWLGLSSARPNAASLALSATFRTRRPRSSVAACRSSGI